MMGQVKNIEHTEETINTKFSSKIRKKWTTSETYTYMGVNNNLNFEGIQ
jgi:hypothetical protein